jgi:putative glutamine amidotransferase
MPTQSFPELVIGVTTRRGDPAWVTNNTQNYLNILAEYGATALILAPDTPVILAGKGLIRPDAVGRLPATVLDDLDGVIFSGGGDVDPRYFGEPLNGTDPDSIDHLRDELELNLGQAALQQDIPVFAICRGCQVLNVAAGGKLVQHFDHHRAKPGDGTYHGVDLLPTSRLRQIVGQPGLQVNTYHHQGVDHATLSPRFAPAALAEQDTWLIEAYESQSHRWVVGVQWHPERIFELEEGHRRLWESFLQACAERRSVRLAGQRQENVDGNANQPLRL